ncbi:MAG: hypothetical protein OXH65_08885 [Paracoccaceae bacterium]|nr:hypothetical protein [Paracoccaceae bacterium]MDE2675206.1 hypothetical protein [Paracoccaceae bacterium]MXZ51376.1 hypothetical protein [Paracoccaceae bacterium]MYF47049.1 hypothetical protein [Paracoccaceae bacterium]MYI91269.1 hypothetical protein [Paracoccaceae bacterium]
MSLVQDTFLTYSSPRKTIRSRLVSTSEADALIYLMMGLVFNFIGSIPFLLDSSGEIPITAFLSANFIGVVIFAPLLFYFISVLGKFAVMILGWRIRWIHSRIALFWAFFIVFPLIMAKGMITYIPMKYGEILQDSFSILIFAFFLTIWLLGLHEANKLKDHI